MKPVAQVETLPCSTWKRPVSGLRRHPAGLPLSAWWEPGGAAGPHTQRFSNPLVPCKCLILKIREETCVRSVLGA